MHEPWHKFIPPFFGFLGAAGMMTFLDTRVARVWILALLSGPVFAFLGTDMAVGYLRSVFDWLPPGEEPMLKLSGLVGCVIGLLSIFLVGAAATAGKRLAADPFNPRTPK